LVLACGGDDSSGSSEVTGTDGSTSASESESSSGSSTGTTQSTETSAGDGDGAADSAESTGDDSSDTTTGGSDGQVALGISIVNIEANQGTGEDIALGANAAGPGDRDIRLLAGRNTLIRANVAVDSGWVEREIRGKLTYQIAGGETRVQEQVVLISGDSDEGILTTSFYFGLQAGEGETEAGTLFHFEMFEVEGDGAGMSEGVHSSPAAGLSEIGFEDWNMVMKVLYVPITYQGNPVDVNSADGQQRLSVIDDNLFEQKPVTAIESDVRDPVAYSGTVSGLGSFLPFLSQLRQQDNAPWDTYYIGVVHYASDTAGIANYNARYNANHWPSQGDSGLARTIVHETGHNQNMPHVDCPGANYPAGQEPPGGYPYPNGSLNRTGFALLSFLLHKADTTYDYMGYCGPSWASTYSWNQTWDIIAEDNSGNLVTPPSVGKVLNHVREEDGGEQWWVSNERIDVELLSGNIEARWESAGGEILTTLGMRAESSEASGLQWTQLPLPEDRAVADFVRVHETAFGQESVVTPAVVRFSGER
jgi:hypothetical protein